MKLSRRCVEPKPRFPQRDQSKVAWHLIVHRTVSSVNLSILAVKLSFGVRSPRASAVVLQEEPLSVLVRVSGSSTIRELSEGKDQFSMLIGLFLLAQGPKRVIDRLFHSKCMSQGRPL